MVCCLKDKIFALALPCARPSPWTWLCAADVYRWPWP